jgi:hypothetical protein
MGVKKPALRGSLMVILMFILFCGLLLHIRLDTLARHFQSIDLTYKLARDFLHLLHWQE